MKRVFIIYLFVIGISHLSLAQSVIAEQDFDATNDWLYTNNVTFFSHVIDSAINIYPDDAGWDSDGFYGVIDLMTTTQLDYAPLANNVLGAFDLDDEGDYGTSGDAILSFQAIGIKNYNDVSVSFDYDVNGFNVTSDRLEYEIFEDGIGQGNIILVEGTSAEGTESIMVADGVDSIQIDLILNFNGQSDYVGLDNIKIEGYRAPSTPLVFLNEIHYDNTGTDVNEFVEVALDETFSGKLENLQVNLYNGSNGSVYDQLTLDQFTEGSTSEGYTFYTWFPNSIQNGDPDGIALNYNDTLVEFLSYGGTFIANDGPANGIMSVDIGISENSSTPVGTSLQRIGNCSADCPNGLHWTGPTTSSPGDQNTMQVLPVEWLSFTAHNFLNKQVELNWSTANEVNNSHYVIEYSNDAQLWRDIGKVEAVKKRQSIQNYQYVDKLPAKGVNYYRLRQVDIDGLSTHSRIRAVRINMRKHPKIDLYPNPVNDVLKIGNLSNLEHISQILILDVNGHQIAEIDQAGQEILLHQLPNGVYFLVLTYDTHATTLLRFVKQ